MIKRSPRKPQSLVGRQGNGTGGAACLLSDAELHAMRLAAAEDRSRHELGWLDAERERYNLPRRGKPISRMVA